MSKRLKEEIVNFARDLGFVLVGVCDNRYLKEDEERLKEWITKGYAGDMGYLQVEPRLRLDAKESLPSVKSIISLAMPYLKFCPPPSLPDNGQAYGRISLYAWGMDYHKVIGKRLKSIVKFLKEGWGDKSLTMCAFVDATPLLEKTIAQRAGLGFIGKNTTLITKDYGSWVFLSEILLNQELETDVNIFADCSDCWRCVKACPTAALVEPYLLDARRCISYHTIENRTQPIPEEIKERMDSWLLGCDVCQLVCPFNKYVLSATAAEFKPLSYIHNGWLRLEPILRMCSEKEFKSFFSGSAIKRIGWRGLQRNAAIIAANRGARELKPLLEKLRKDAKEIPMLLDALNYSLSSI